MDLLSAKDQAKKQSKKEKRTVYVVVDGEGECSVNGAPLEGTLHAFRNGEEVPLPPVAASKKQETEGTLKGKKAKGNPKPTIEEKQINSKTMAKKAAPVKKAATKAAPAKKSGPKEMGKKVSISIADMRKNIKKGLIYRDPQGVRQTEKYLATRKRQDLVREMFESKES